MQIIKMRQNKEKKKMTKTIIDIAYYSVCAIAFIVSFAIGVVQRAKQKNITKLQALYECIPNAVINAEKLFGDKNGENKKLFVMTTLSNIALQSGTKFDYNELDKRVEDVVKATKHVNITQSVAETFRTGDETQSTETEHLETDFEPVKTDGSVVIEIDKIKGGDKNGTDN